MNVLITGGAGFIGSHLAEAMVAAGHRVAAVDDLSTGSMDNLTSLMDNKSFRFVRDSVRNESSMAVLVDGCDLLLQSVCVG